MESHPSVTDRLARIPPMAWVLGLGLIAALVAIFVFNVSVSTVANIGFIALMLVGHLFMHGSHSGHQSHAHSTPAESNENNQATRSGGCH